MKSSDMLALYKLDYYYYYVVRFVNKRPGHLTEDLLIIRAYHMTSRVHCHNAIRLVPASRFA